MEVVNELALCHYTIAHVHLREMVVLAVVRVRGHRLRVCHLTNKIVHHRLKNLRKTSVGTFCFIHHKKK